MRVSALPVDLASYERQRDKVRQDLALAQMDQQSEALEEIDVAGLLAFAERVLPRASEMWADLIKWGQAVIDVLNAHQYLAESLLMNSDVGLPGQPYPPEVQLENRRTCHNFRFRVYRLDQLLPKLEAQLKSDPNLILVPRKIQ